ncbi:hypothetical protein [Parafrankia elaeagni]|uniref:hypothetical protein n=1 Tax=Parafrankia elaeagni TaxID=222534 RepID=UPI0012B5B706|nr:hypothetical protein [Parafrankia elaeagni]
MGRYVYRRSPLWWVFAKICAAVSALYLVLAAIEWVFEAAPYAVIGGVTVAAAAMVARGSR